LQEVNKTDILEKQKYIFARLFLLAGKLHAVGDRILAGEMTMTQWLLTVAAAQFGRNPPTISQAAEIMGTSHQNVKQLALKLQKSGFLQIKKDAGDGRANLLALTEKSSVFFEERKGELKQFFEQLFSDLSSNEIDSLFDCLTKLYKNVIELNTLN
jgi:DNA-binding MarR family transcriptional regulator